MKRFALGLVTSLIVMSSAAASAAQTRYGLSLAAGGRYDDVRMCVASGAGTKGGPAMEGSLFIELPLWAKADLRIDLPLLRPALFGAAFQMLQLEPWAALQISHGRFVYGPSVGLVLHYGPDFRSENSGDARGPSFFALGPRIGAYAGVQWLRPDGWFDLRLGAHPYVAPLFPTGDGERGVVVGGMLQLDFLIR